MSRSIRVWMCVFAAGIISVAAGLGAGAPDPTATNMAQVTVTVHPRQQGTHPVVTPDDIVVYENNQSRPVVSWVAAKAQSRPLDLTVLLDDSLTSKVGLQFGDMAKFFQSLPASTRVRIAYASHGGDQVIQDFTTDRQLAAQALRLPFGPVQAGASIYQSVAELLKNWPRNGDRRALLLISDGIDIYQGIMDSEPYTNMELQRAIDLAQSGNVPVYSIFASTVRQLDRNMFLLVNGQGCLMRLTSETGGQSFFEGTHTPVAFAPYLRQVATDLRHQYLLTFQTLPAPKKGYQRLRVTTQIPGVELFAPARVYLGKAG